VWPPPASGYAQQGYGGWVNDSGTGSMAQLPVELRGLNWGGFLMTWIWSIANKSYIGLLSLVPYVGWIMHFVILIKGNEWAWQNRRWESIEDFKNCQRLWAYWGLGLFIGLIVLWGIAMLVIMATSGTNSSSSYHVSN